MLHVQVADVAGVGLDEALAWRHLVAHQHRHQLVGGVRDVPYIKQMRMPVFARSATGPPSPLTPIEANVPINCGGAAVVPGDIVVADDDGVCIVPRERAEELARICVEHEEIEVWLRERLARGESIVGLYPPSEAVREQFRQTKR